METLPAEVLAAEILGRCAEYAPVLRAVCRGWRTLATSAAARTTKNKGLSFLAGRGHAELLAWVLEQRARPFHTGQANKILVAAAAEGHVFLCGEARAWGATNWNIMLCIAASGGHASLCEKARAWGATDWDLMLLAATTGGPAALCELAEKWRRGEDA